MRTVFKFIVALLLFVGSASAQTQYCGYDPSSRTLVNMALYSEQFDNAAWVTVTPTITANNTTAPDGTTTAEKMVPSAGSALQNTFQSITVLTDTYRFCVYAKSFGYSFLQLSNGALSSFQNFDLTLGVLGTGSGNVSSSITAVGNGWYNVCYTNAYTAGTNTYRISVVPLATSARSAVFTGDGTQGVYLWGAQLNLASAPSTYISTTDTAVTAGLTGSTAKVTLSNLVTYSQQFDNAAWQKPQSTVTANTIAAPDGTLTADTMLETAVTNYHSVYQFVNVTSGLTYRMAVYAKAQNRSVIQIEGSSGAFGANAYASYNLANGTLGAVGSAATASIASVGNGWYLCTLIAPATATTTSAFNIHTATTIGAALRESYLGVITNGVYLWGGYENLAAQPADYLATTSAAATLGPLCAAGTSQSYNDPTRCYAVSTTNPLKLTPFQGSTTGTSVDYNQRPITPQRGASN